MVLEMWSRSCGVSRAGVEAVLLCHTVCTRMDPRIGAERSTRKLKEALKEQKQKQKVEFLEAAVTLSPAWHIEESLKTSTKKFEPSLVHSFSVLQAITFGVLALNKLLGSVYSFPRICDLFNGTFIYNVTLILSRKKPREKILPNEVEVEFERTLECVLKIVTNLQEQITPKAKKPKKKSKPINEDRDISSEQEQDTFHDLGNRFTALSVQ